MVRLWCYLAALLASVDIDQAFEFVAHEKPPCAEAGMACVNIRQCASFQTRQQILRYRPKPCKFTGLTPWVCCGKLKVPPAPVSVQLADRPIAAGGPVESLIRGSLFTEPVELDPPSQKPTKTGSPAQDSITMETVLEQSVKDQMPIQTGQPTQDSITMETVLGQSVKDQMPIETGPPAQDSITMETVLEQSVKDQKPTKTGSPAHDSITMETVLEQSVKDQMSIQTGPPPTQESITMETVLEQPLNDQMSIQTGSPTQDFVTMETELEQLLNDEMSIPTAPLSQY